MGVNRGFARLPCCMAGTIDSSLYGKKTSFLYKIFPLFLPCNMAAVQNLYPIKHYLKRLLSKTFKLQFLFMRAILNKRFGPYIKYHSTLICLFPCYTIIFRNHFCYSQFSVGSFSVAFLCPVYVFRTVAGKTSLGFLSFTVIIRYFVTAVTTCNASKI